MKNQGLLLALVGAFTPLCWQCSTPRSFQPEIVNGGRAVAITVDPDNERNVVVASETGGLFRSTDGGDTWKQVSGAITFGFTDVLYTGPSTLSATARPDMHTISNGGLWRSTDGGNTWVRPVLITPTVDCRNNLGAYCLARVPGRNRVWAGTECGLAFSDDTGANWSYIRPGTNYSNDKVYAVQAPTINDLVILTDSGVKVSTDTGRTWTVSSNGLPDRITARRVHNQLALSPFEHRHVFWAFDYWRRTIKPDSTIEDTLYKALYLSTDNGKNWSPVYDKKGKGRPPFVQVAQALSGTANTYDLYFSNGAKEWQRAPVTHRFTPIIGSWTSLDLSGEIGGHADPAALALRNDGKTPYLLVGDGGIHRTPDKGLTWPLTGGGSKGYNALQITEVTGQRHLQGKVDLYFGTQDNDIWGSRDNGRTWPKKVGSEGFYLGLPQSHLPDNQTRVSGVACVPCGNFITDPGLANELVFPNVSNYDGAPCFIKPKTYLQISKVPGVDTTVYQLTTDEGSSWKTRFGFAEDREAQPTIAAGGAEPVLYIPVKLPGMTPDHYDLIGIRRVVGLLRQEQPLLSDVSGFGSLGTFPTAFAWYKPFGAYPFDPNVLIVPDYLDQAVKVTRDGGAHWKVDTALTRLVTQQGALLFRKNGFMQISCFGFDPDHANHWMVGTQQAGIFQTFDHGAHWEKVAGSELLPNVSSFFFMGNGDVAVSTYGRGLWKLHVEVPKPERTLPPPKRHLDLEEPLVYYQGVYIPLKDLGNPEVCPVCNFYLLEGGRVAGFALEAGAMNQVMLLSGKIEGFNLEGIRQPLPFTLQYVREMGKMGDDPALAAFLEEQKLDIKGFFLEGKQMKGVLLARQDVRPEQLPKPKPPLPRIRVYLTDDPSDLATVSGQGFDPKYPLEITLNGKAVKPLRRPVFDRKGRFTFLLAVPGDTDGYTVEVRQKTPSAVRQDAQTFHIPVQEKE